MAINRPIRAYVDTSVFGGCFDDEFATASRRFFDAVRDGRFTILLGSTVEAELIPAPQQVQAILHGLPPNVVVSCRVTQEVVDLTLDYLNAGALSDKWADDATHVATATVHRADLLLSWNFRHIVNYDRIRAFNAVNIRQGYQPLAIHSPMEIPFYEEAEEV